MGSKKNTELPGQDRGLHCSFVEHGDKKGLVNFLTQRDASVKTVSVRHAKRKTLPLHVADRCPRDASVETVSFPLHVAVNVPPDECPPHIVKYLIAEGANCNAYDGDGLSPLHYSVFHNNTDATKTLLDAGANVNIQADPPFPPIAETGRSLTRSQMIGRWNQKRTYPLHLAVRVNSKNLPATLRNADNTGVDDGSALDSEDQKYSLIKLLLVHGADCNLIDGNHLGPLHYAVSQNDECLVSLLLDAGADINIRSPEKRETPLFHVSHVSMLKYLLSRNADPAIQAWNTTTVLHTFIAKCRSDLTKYLISDTDVCLLGAHLNRYQSPLAVEYIDKLLREITENASRSLVDLCTFRIRQILKRNINTAVNSLPLPTKLKDRITSAHVHLSL